MCLFFVTSNEHKFREVSRIFGDRGIDVCWYKLKYPELQDSNLENIAIESAKIVYNKLKKPLFLEDTGLFIKSLNGFPGPYSAFVFDTIGTRGIIKLMQGIEDRTAYFETVVAYISNEVNIYTFVGKRYGKIALNERGTSWGYDPIFIPDGYDKTYAELGDEKNRISHRMIAMRKFIEWYLKEKGE